MIRLPRLRRAALAAAGMALMIPLTARSAENESLDARQTVVVANRNVPASIELARYYMEQRGIPENHLCLVDLPEVETIARRIYESGLRDPLQAFMREQGLIDQVKRKTDEWLPGMNPWRTVRYHVRYVVLMYGMPLRIAETRPFLLSKVSRLFNEPFQRDGAAVDSELACLLWDTYPLEGIQSNPMYNEPLWSRSDRLNRPVLIAARLDGPDPEIVRRMIDDAVEVEKNGLTGRAYIDMRSIRDPDYLMGEIWLREAGLRLERSGYNVQFDLKDDVFPVHYPMDEAAFYLGWYRSNVDGPFLREDFSFRPGAVAYHLHSTSARSLRTRREHWAGPLLAAGAAAVMGAIDEPYLRFTPDLQVFMNMLMEGRTFGESAYIAQRVLSWQITVAGDPLYRPMVKISTATSALRPDGTPSTWRPVMWMNLLASSHRLNPSIAFGRDILSGTENNAVREKLGDLYAANELWDDAVEAYRATAAAAGGVDTAVRAASKAVRILNALNRPLEAATVKQEVRSRWPDHIQLKFLEESAP